MVNKQSLVYLSGDVFLPSVLRQFLQTYLIGNSRSTFYITYWSIVHLLSGIAFATLFLWVNPVLAPSKTSVYMYGLGVHTLWELWQIVIGMSRPFALSGHNSLVDICMDTLLFLVGIWITVRLQQGFFPQIKR